ncbi:MAG TPA: ABATE domain-containing protein [Terriglobales bacterium]|nr:ABATE domain-containing protein [Terriglobales bacterium]
MGRAASKNNSDWKDGFLFLGNQLALDFVNTRPVQDGRAMELLPDFQAVLRWFQAADVVTAQQARSLQQQCGNSPEARQAVEALRALREKLRKEILAREAGGKLHHATLEELNCLMAQHPMRTRLRIAGKGLTTELYFEPQQPGDLFAPLAHSAAELFSDVDPRRVRKCAHCVLHFHDTSKKGTRRWCSMQLCGNREKVAAYAARQRRQRRRARKV